MGLANVPIFRRDGSTSMARSGRVGAVYPKWDAYQPSLIFDLWFSFFLIFLETPA